MLEEILRRLAGWKQRARRLLRRSAVEAELSEELEMFLEHQVTENLAKGMTPDEARRAAQSDLGSVLRVKDACRDVWRKD